MSYFREVLSLAMLMSLMAGCSAITDAADQSDAKGKDAIACTMEARPGLSVRAVDAGTGTTLQTFTVIARQGAFADTARVPSVIPDPVASLAYERAGVYEVAVLAEGYDRWQQSSVEVTADPCHVRTVQIEARLKPSGP